MTGLSEQSKQIRKQILIEAYKHKHGHIASCFSCVEILLAIKEVMKPGDRFILSKGHAILAEKAVFGKEISCYKTGSLGHGLGVACGIALGDPDHNVYVVVGDGELQEGSCYEALQFIGKNQLSNLKVIIDDNGFQASCETMYDITPEKLGHICAWKVFPSNCDGHNIEEIKEEISINNDYAHIIIASTDKGKGSVIISNNPIEWHTRVPMNEQEYNSLLMEISNA